MEQPVDLPTAADDAEDVVAGFTVFRAPLPQHATELTTVISEYYAIIAALTTLDTLSKDARYRRNWPRIQSDLHLVLASLKYTGEDILDFFGKLDGANAPPERYNAVWAAMNRFFWDETKYSFSTRLAKYKTFLRDLCDSMKDYHDGPLHTGLRNSIRTLVVSQAQRWKPRLARMAPNPAPSSSGSQSAEPGSPVNDRRPRRRSYERMRPPHLSPQSPLSPVSGTSSDIPPAAPDAPSSPVTTTATASTSATTNTSRSNKSEAVEYHWIKEVLTSYETETPIPRARDRAGCFGDPHPGIKQELREQGFEQLLQLAFSDESEITIYFWLRPSDSRVRIVCKVPHRTRPSDYYCLPLNMLEIIRQGSCLELCRRRHSGTQLVMWARLKFQTIESMVFFFCTFLALRGQDKGRPVEDIRDYELELEEELFGGQIFDDDYPHGLRIFQDTVSGAVRLQASVHKGPMDHTPVWTAFITHLLGRKGWIRQEGSRTIIVRNLKPTIFMSAEDYNPPQTPRGEQILKFATRDDAEEFLNVIDEITMNLLR